MIRDFDYKKWNTIVGWITFAIALITYTLTLEPTVSPWDCGEYISTSTKLSVGHPPGAPLFQMLGAFFSMFAFGEENIAYMINFMSGLASAFTILFMFWSITFLSKKMISNDDELKLSEKIIVLASGFVGALAYTFSDSFWFSAVEGEVYAMSSFLMALLLWLGLHWTEEIHEERGNKWLVLISFVVGMSFGVHILSLLVIPSIVMLYFFKTYKNITLKTTLIASVISVLVLAFIFKFFFPMTLKFFSVSELFFINTIGLPYNSGSIIAFILLVAIFYYSLKYTRERNLIKVNTLILSVLFMMIGFSTWMMLPIRANANTTINENNPSSARELLAYYNREQYGDKNVFYDTYYSAKYEDDSETSYEDDKPKYEKINGKYEIVNNPKNAVLKHSDRHKGFIPRMVSSSCETAYKQIAGIPLNSKERPTFAQNLRFMLSYQFGYMYGRYFMWNFVGRQDDIQGHLDDHGNWISGISFIDNSRDNITEDAENKGRNTYFFLPLILGLFGLFYQIRKDVNNFYVLTLFFVFTGFAIIFYTNPKPFEPRERDYAVVGSFYIFAMWIGFGVLALYEYLKAKANPKMVAVGVSLLSLLSVPVLMGFQNWDDHDRSGRYITRFGAQAYLESCDPNAILFTIGDNDTFPLWYLQEVEGVRTDVKCVNTSLFATDWYIDQMKKATYKAPPIPSKLTHKQYRLGTLDIALIDPYHYAKYPNVCNKRLPLSKFMEILESDDPKTFQKQENGQDMKVLPTGKIRIPVNKDNVLKSGIVKFADRDKIVDYIDVDFNQAGLGKNNIMMLDIINNFDWKRPIYFTGGSGDDSEYIWMKDYLQLDGLSYKLVPIKTDSSKSLFSLGRIDADKMYQNMMKLDWDSLNTDYYIDEQSKKNCLNIRNNCIRLAEELIKKGDKAKAKKIVDLSLEKMPVKKFGHYSIAKGYIKTYYKLGEPKKAREIAEILLGIYKEKIAKDTSKRNLLHVDYDMLDANVYMYSSIVNLIVKNDADIEYIKKYKLKRQEDLKEAYAVLIDLSQRDLDYFYSRIPKDQTQFGYFVRDNFQEIMQKTYDYIDLIDSVELVYGDTKHVQQLKKDRESRLKISFDIILSLFKGQMEMFGSMPLDKLKENFKSFMMISEKYKETIEEIKRVYSGGYRNKAISDYNNYMDKIKSNFDE